MVRSIGADQVIDYTRDEIAGRYDVIIDTGGNMPLARLRSLLRPDGTLVIVGGEGGGDWFGIARQLGAVMLSRSKGQKLRSFICKENHEDMLVLKDLIESGKLAPVIDRTYPLAGVPEAIRRLQEGRVREAGQDLRPQRRQRSSVSHQPASHLRERVPFEFQLAVHFLGLADIAKFL